jgi:L-amino acid N-acyltransferase YncA
MDYQIEAMGQEDWQAVHAIHAEGIATGIASFAGEAPAWEAWDADYLSIARFVARGANDVLGWAALSPVSSH